MKMKMKDKIKKIIPTVTFFSSSFFFSLTDLGLGHVSVIVVVIVFRGYDEDIGAVVVTAGHGAHGCLTCGEKKRKQKKRKEGERKKGKCRIGTASRSCQMRKKEGGTRDRDEAEDRRAKAGGKQRRLMLRLKVEIPTVTSDERIVHSLHEEIHSVPVNQTPKKVSKRAGG